LKEEKTTKSKEQDNIQPAITVNSSSTEILPSENPEGAVKTTPKLCPEETVVSPEMPRATNTVIRPSTIQKDESFTGRATDLMESMKDKTGEAFDSIKSATGQGVCRTTSNLGSQPLVIPILEQKSSSVTKTYTEEIMIEKRKVERKKNIEIKVAYDEIFVNGKEIGSSVGDTFKEIKDKILEMVSFDHDRDEKELEKISSRFSETDTAVKKIFEKVVDTHKINPEKIELLNLNGKTTYRVDKLTKLTKEQRKFLSKIYEIITANCDKKTAESLIKKIEEELQ